jgi:pimeloyl-ACP methyl ester carboxylesterase
VRETGPADGRPVTLLHGFPTSSHDWALVAPALAAAGLRVTMPDFLGFGASDKPRGHRYRLTEQADLIEELWARLDIRETALVAHDYGVSVAQELLARDRSRITRMAWCNGGLYPELHRPIPVQRLLHSPIGRMLAPLSTERTYTRALRAILGRPLSPQTLHEMWCATSSGGGTRVQWRLLRYLDDRRAHAPRRRQALESYPGPTLFVWGPADPISGAHMVAHARARAPHAEFVVLDDPPATGHYPQLENPEPVAEALARFLN